MIVLVNRVAVPDSSAEQDLIAAEAARRDGRFPSPARSNTEPVGCTQRVLFFALFSGRHARAARCVHGLT